MSPRFFCPVTLTDTLVLPEATAHHAIRVLRMRVGDSLVLFDGRGGERAGVIDSISREIVVRLSDLEAIDRESPLAITLYQALPSGDKMDWVVQKTVELGVSAIVPVRAERSVLQLSGERAAKRVAHWQAVAVSACEQSGRNRVPPVSEILPFTAALSACQASHRYILAPGRGVSRSVSLSGLEDAPGGTIALLIGPEGGWTEAELDAAHVAGWVSLTLGPRILRTETAGPAALAALAACFGDF